LQVKISPVESYSPTQYPPRTNFLRSKIYCKRFCLFYTTWTTGLLTLLQIQFLFRLMFLMLPIRLIIVYTIIKITSKHIRLV